MRMEIGWVEFGGGIEPAAVTQRKRQLMPLVFWRQRPFSFSQRELTTLAGNEQLRAGDRCGVCRHRDRCGSDQYEVSN